MIAARAGGVFAMIVGFVSSQLFGFLFSTQILIWVAVGGRAHDPRPDHRRRSASASSRSKLSSSYADRVGALPRAALRRGRRLHPGRRPAADRAPASGVCSTGAGRRASAGSSWPRHGRAPELRPARRAGLRRSRRSSSPTGRCRCCAASTSRSSRASCSASSARTAPASRRCSTSSPTASCRCAGAIVVLPAPRRGGAEGRSRSTGSRAAGVARKFQIPHLFDSLTVAETILARLDAQGAAPVGVAAHPGGPGRCGRCTTSSRRPALDGREDDAARRALAHGLKQGLELAAAAVDAAGAAPARRADRRADEQRAPRDRRRLPAAASTRA